MEQAEVGRVGPLRIEVRGSGRLRHCFHSEIGMASPDQGRSDLCIDLVRRGRSPELGRPAIFSAKWHVAFSSSTLTADDPQRYVVKDLFTPGSQCNVIVERGTERLATRVRRWFGGELGMEPATSYSLLWYVIHMLLLRNEAASLHASMVELDDRAIGIAGTGGAGKTSVLLGLMSARPNARYLSEDFGILDRSGFAYPSPKTLSVYSSDAGSAFLDTAALLAARPIVDRVRWQLYRRVLNRSPMMKVPVAVAIPPDRIGHGSPLASMVFLIRTTEPELDVAPCDTGEFIDRLVRVSWREHRRLLELLNLITANAPGDWPWPAPHQVDQRLREILTDGLSHSALWTAKVPATAEPPRIISALRDAGAI